MTKREFKRFETICKNEWVRIARTGATEKSKKMDKFSSRCPACEISDRAEEYYLSCSCEFCPITTWRNQARRKGGEPCMSGVYGAWLIACGSFCKKSLVEKEWKKLMAGIALRISRMKWSWVKEYEKIDGAISRRR